MTFRSSSASRELDADPMGMYKLKESVRFWTP